MFLSTTLYRLENEVDVSDGPGPGINLRFKIPGSVSSEAYVHLTPDEADRIARLLTEAAAKARAAKDAA